MCIGRDRSCDLVLALESLLGLGRRAGCQEIGEFLGGLEIHLREESGEFVRDIRDDVALADSGKFRAAKVRLVPGDNQDTELL